MGAKIGILLLNLGGPDNPDAIRPFLYNLFSDPDIFTFPSSSLLQKPMAWLISRLREGITRDNYQQMGGCSPILPLTQAQADALKARLWEEGIDSNVYVGMRYWYPLIEDAVEQILQDNIEQLVVLPLYPQYSLTTTGSSLNELNRVLKNRPAEISITTIEHFYLDSGYQAALADTIQEGLREYPWTCTKEKVRILFSAHSLPQRFVEKTGDVYPHQIHETAQQVMARWFANNPWQLCYQSRIGMIPWLQPYTDDALRDLAKQDANNILMVPVSFVSDHVETLYEIDKLYLPIAQQLGIQHCYRTQSLNTRPAFIDALAGLVKAHINAWDNVRV